MPIVNGLAEEYKGKLDFHIVKTTADGADAAIKKYGLDIHGMVIVDDTDKVVWSESGHKQTKEGVKKAIDAALGS